MLKDTESIKVPHLTTAIKGPLHHLERHLLDHQVNIECWLRHQWRDVPLLFYSSVDLRNAGFKLAPVDTNLFPAGFNNLNPDFMPLCIQAAQVTLEQLAPKAINILLIPESHTQHIFYFEHLAHLQEILTKAGFVVRIGSLIEQLKSHKEIKLPSGKYLKLEPLQRHDDRISVDDFEPHLIILNNDLSNGVPPILQNLTQHIVPSLALGWAMRSKSKHFKHYSQVADRFAQEFSIDPWLISPLFHYCGEVDFLTGEGHDCLLSQAQNLFDALKEKYEQYGIKHSPFLVIKADAGTYGLAVMTIKHPSEITHLNRKERLSMSVTKGGRAVSRVIIQEGIYTFETWGNNRHVAEPVVYMIGRHVVGGFYRVHSKRSIDENLNAPGMNFEPLAFAGACNNPCQLEKDCNNRFYAYGVIARLAMLAAALELKEVA